MPVHLTLVDLRVLLGGVHEALFELGDEEFHLRVGVTGDDARVLMQHLLCLLYTSPSPRDRTRSRMPSSA